MISVWKKVHAIKWLFIYRRDLVVCYDFLLFFFLFLFFFCVCVFFFVVVFVVVFFALFH